MVIESIIMRSCIDSFTQIAQIGFFSRTCSVETRSWTGIFNRWRVHRESRRHLSSLPETNLRYLCIHGIRMDLCNCYPIRLLPKFILFEICPCCPWPKRIRRTRFIEETKYGPGLKGIMQQDICAKNVDHSEFALRRYESTSASLVRFLRGIFSLLRTLHAVSPEGRRSSASVCSPSNDISLQR